MKMTEEIKIPSKYIGLLLTILTIISIIMSAAIAYAITNETVNYHSAQIQELKEETKVIKQDVSDIKTSIAIFEKVSEDVKEIKQDVKILSKEVQK